MVSILVFPGTNCHEDIEYIYRNLGFACAFVKHTESRLPRQTRLAVLAGGFSYGDYLRCGAMASTTPSIRALKKYADNGGRVLGICNGFQILCEAKLLPGVLMRNENLRFISKNAPLIVENTNNFMLAKYKINQLLRIPVAHAEGNYQVDIPTLESMKANNQILLKYAQNLNGSIESIAGICNAEKTIYALMPHPERASNFKNINRFTQDNSLENIAGIEMLRSLV
ncbi:phosphoribosylformylglycinamidine synthase subunit PurQ [Helicobacter saguini]|uniref:Phosphoribosylformylglycinamidine synthase subunit PurQ n=1 Tax=Helicobacter saguini TaxID=1548018 RepID=A0A347VPU0_9HELI|nr:phosphoribosylformylglycinamidine synthase subunit PurQ [Helicobacter saguini]MWV61215.1 phosphoribosylformylglycinamidine synthase subunit PurQ [Helicobacter saguini]MWV68118.1 phosphoribosylformylglycinamidine synthase subunit PurQ [Helicobacter saguini]MWV70418.1 phosphoribosylformylglycinamidine synthase subunit PurQ [Helicobacter saguini]MWV72319.1 phosphoribosylformylglycinamidine synthase subunit PurQ [Helicobacter saguini]TLD92974.1 phosphoribosylformylglycinamidine synthase subunit